MAREIKVLEVKGRKIGGDTAQICMPIVARTEEELMLEAGAILVHQPDIVEWRVDYYDDVEDPKKVLNSLSKLRDKLKDFPIIFTLRIDLEGGFRKLEPEYRMGLIKDVMKTKQVDLVDIELINPEEEINDIINTGKENGVYVILSNHDFKKTPSKEEIVERLVKAQELGADIGKIAVMANSSEDLLVLLEATNMVKEQYANIPMVTMSMSTKGLISRLAGGVFGSAITFAAGRDVSAPGQIPAPELRKVLEVITKYSN